jgi:hypothetical protein
MAAKIRGSKAATLVKQVTENPRLVYVKMAHACSRIVTFVRLAASVAVTSAMKATFLTNLLACAGAKLASLITATSANHQVPTVATDASMDMRSTEKQLFVKTLCVK